MKTNKPVVIEMFYTLTCPNCKILQRMLDDLLPQFGEKFVLKKTMANTPLGMFRTLKLGIHTVPALLINNEIAYKHVPEKQELIEQLKKY